MGENNNIVETEAQEVNEAEQNNEELEQVTFTQKEVDSKIAQAVTAAVAKAKSKQAKTSDERISALEAELAKRDNMDYARSKVKEAGIPSDIVSLFYSSSNEETDDKVDAFATFWKEAIDSAVRERLGESKPIDLGATPLKPSSKPQSFLQYYNKHSK